MLHIIFEYLVAVLPFYRASIDAGIDMIDQKALIEYIDAWSNPNRK